MKTLEMEIALMEHYDVRQNVIVPNVAWGLQIHECDLISLTIAGYATEIEIKVSKADLLKDFEKWHEHLSNKIKYFYYAVPKNMEEFTREKIPERAGLITVKQEYGEYLVTVVKFGLENKAAVKWSNDDRLQLCRLGAMRILGLKRKIRGLKMQKLTT